MKLYFNMSCLQVIIRRDIVTALSINVPVTYILYSNGLRLPPLLPPTRCIQWCSGVVLYARLHVPVNWCDGISIRVLLRRHRGRSSHNVNPIRPLSPKKKSREFRHLSDFVTFARFLLAVFNWAAVPSSTFAPQIRNKGCRWKIVKRIACVYM